MKKTIGTKLITYTKRLKLKIQSGVWNFKYTMLKKEEKETKTKTKTKTRSKNYKIYIYMKFAEEEKIGSFFFLQSNRL